MIKNTMALDIYLVISFFTFGLLLFAVLRSLNLSVLMRLPRTERLKVLQAKFQWWWLMVLLIPLANIVITSLAY